MYFPKLYTVSQAHQNIELQSANKSPSKFNNDKSQSQPNNLHSRSQSSYLTPPLAFAINLESPSVHRQLSNAINSPSQKSGPKNPEFANLRKYRIERKLQCISKQMVGPKGRKISEEITIENNSQNLQQKDDIFINNKNGIPKSPKSAHIKQRKISCNLQFPTFFKWSRKDSENSSGAQKKVKPQTGIIKKKNMGWVEQNNFKFSTNLNSDESSQRYQQINFAQIPKLQAIRKQSENESPKKQTPSFITNKNHRNSVDAVDCPKVNLGINNFVILRELGNGTFGRVVLAIQRESGMIFAIKVISKRQIKQSKMIEQLTRELKIQQHVNHPNIIKVYGYFDDFLHFFIIMECAMDANLSQTIKNRTSSLCEAEAATIMNQICQAVSYLHGQCIIHRDLKPDNILFHEGVVKITDFGWSVVLDGRLRTTFCGTPVYLCPQILMGDQYNESVDIWTIGVILYEMFYKSNPFRITCKQQLINILNKPIYFDERIEASIKGKDFILDCLKKRAAERPSIRQLLLHQFLTKAIPIQQQRRYQ